MVFDELEMLYEEYDDSFTEITSAYGDDLSALEYCENCSGCICDDIIPCQHGDIWD